MTTWKAAMVRRMDPSQCRLTPVYVAFSVRSC
jgi:hypothetical protein